MRTTAMVNRTMIQSFHWYSNGDGNFWQEAAASAKQLGALGITAVWLPPACKGREGIASNGYDVYDLYDLGEFEQKETVRTKFGTKNDYLLAIKAFHDQGITVYADVVLNHKAGADATQKIKVRKVDPEDRNKFISPLFFIEAFTIFNFPGREKQYSAFCWDHHCFSGVDYAADTGEKGIFKIANRFGKGWDKVAGKEKGNFDYLMFADIEFRNPAVKRELTSWGKWYLKTTSIDGFRLDAVKHMSVRFINGWLDAMARQQPGLFAVGELWAPDDLPLLKRYIKATGKRMSLFDARLHHNFCDAGEKGKDYDLSTIFNDTLVQSMPASAVTIVDNHDTQPFQEMNSMVAAWFKPLAYALIPLRKSGYPCLFYPDLYGAKYAAADKDGHIHDIIIEKCAGIEALLLARKKHAYGRQTDYFDDAGCIGWVRQGTRNRKQSGCAVLLSNDSDAYLKMKIGKQHAGKIFTDLLGAGQRKVVITNAGWGRFYVKGRSVAVWA